VGDMHTHIKHLARGRKGPLDALVITAGTAGYVVQDFKDNQHCTAMSTM
jgi:hypothetical protein